MSENTFNILVGCSGSVASLKVPELVERLCQLDKKIAVKVVPTEKALHFFNVDVLSVPVHTDTEEWQLWQKRGDPVLHVDLRRWADVMLIAPLDANTLGKVASGICDNLLLCTVRAWDVRKPMLFAPAMNTLMYEHPITKQQIDLLRSWGYTEIPTIEKVLVCNDKGLGAMAEVSTIVHAVKELFEAHCQRISLGNPSTTDDS